MLVSVSIVVSMSRKGGSVHERLATVGKKRETRPVSVCRAGSKNREICGVSSEEQYRARGRARSERSVRDVFLAGVCDTNCYVAKCSVSR